MADGALETSRAFGATLPPGRFGALDGAAGVTVAERPWPAALCVFAPAAALPGPGRCALVDGARAFALGPGRWLLAGPPDALARWRGPDSVDVSDAYAVLHLQGPATREVLARIAPIDLHPHVFRVDDVASTRAGGMDLLLWQIDATPQFGLAVARSYAGSLAHWLMQSALAFGLAVETGRAARGGSLGG